MKNSTLYHKIKFVYPQVFFTQNRYFSTKNARLRAHEIPGTAAYLPRRRRKGGGGMSVIGVVAEYNPFHNGHAYMLRQARAQAGAQAAVAVMSGSFVQRAEPAVIPKAARVEAALRGGVDLVLELPVDFARRFGGGLCARGRYGFCMRWAWWIFWAFGCEAGEGGTARAAGGAGCARLLFPPRCGRISTEGWRSPPRARRRWSAWQGRIRRRCLRRPIICLLWNIARRWRNLTAPCSRWRCKRPGRGARSGRAGGDLRFGAVSARPAARGRDWLGSVRAGRKRACAAPGDGARTSGAGSADAVQLGRLRALDEDALAQLPGMREGLEHRLARAIAAGHVAAGGVFLCKVQALCAFCHPAGCALPLFSVCVRSRWMRCRLPSGFWALHRPVRRCCGRPSRRPGCPL